MCREKGVPGGRFAGRKICREEHVPGGKISIRKVFVRNYLGKKTFGRVLNSRKSGDNQFRDIIQR